MQYQSEMDFFFLNHCSTLKTINCRPIIILPQISISVTFSLKFGQVTHFKLYIINIFTNVRVGHSSVIICYRYQSLCKLFIFNCMIYIHLCQNWSELVLRLQYHRANILVFISNRNIYTPHHTTDAGVP